MIETQRYVPKIHLIGDSIPYGVGCTALAGWREVFYFNARTAGRPIYNVGSISYSGPTAGLAIDPYCESVPGAELASSGATFAARISTYEPDVVICELGTNDLDAGAGGKTPAQTAALMSTQLDLMWQRRTREDFQIIVLGLLLRYDGQDALVTAYNALLPGVIAAKSYADHVTLIQQVDANLIFPTDYALTVHPNNVGATKLANFLTPLILAVARTAAGGR
jgi:lysophospholipase L1-like esterase